MRNPTGMATVTVKIGQMGPQERIYVVCDDGTVWYLTKPWTVWLPAPPMPGTEGAESLDSGGNATVGDEGGTAPIEPRSENAEDLGKGALVSDAIDWDRAERRLRERRASDRPDAQE